MTLEVVVWEEPAPQGSKTKMPNGAIVEAASSTGRRKLTAYRAAVTRAAIEACARAGWRTLTDVPVLLEVTAYMPRPASAKRRYPHVKPDLSKMVRATEDALTTAGVWKDDSLVIDTVSRKRYAPAAPHAVIRVTEVTW